MCGIGGVWFGRDVDIPFLERLIVQSERRGLDGLGVAVVKPGGDVFYFKEASRASVAIKDKRWDFIAGNIEPRDIVLFNTRAQPLTEVETTSHEMQPVSSRNYVAVHNGVVSNEKDVKNNILDPSGVKRSTNIDSEVIPHLLEIMSVKEAFAELSGGFAVAAAPVGCQGLHLIKDFKTLAWSWDETSKTFAFASEPQFIQQARGAGNNSLLRNVFDAGFAPFESFTINHIPAYTHVLLSFFTGRPSLEWVEDIETKAVSSLPQQRESAIICASGGIDSSTSAYVAKYIHKCDVKLVHFAHGQKSHRKELLSVMKIAEALGVPWEVLDLKWLGSLGQSVLTDPDRPVPVAHSENVKSTVCWTPARNLTMMSALAAVAEAEGARYIYAGWSLEEEGSYPDNSIDFFRTLNECLKYGTIARPQVRLALSRLMKKETVLLGHELGVPYEHTWSCDNGEHEGHCGRCGACFLHHYAFLQAGLPDPTKYARPLEFPFKPPWDKPGFEATPVLFEMLLEKLT